MISAGENFVISVTEKKIRLLLASIQLKLTISTSAMENAIKIDFWLISKN